jgi:hypothetical protein
MDVVLDPCNGFLLMIFADLNKYRGLHVLMCLFNFDAHIFLSADSRKYY